MVSNRVQPLTGRATQASRSLPLVKHQLAHQAALTGRLGAGRRNHAAGVKWNAGSVLPRSVAGRKLPTALDQPNPAKRPKRSFNRVESFHSMMVTRR